MDIKKGESLWMLIHDSQDFKEQLKPVCTSPLCFSRINYHLRESIMNPLSLFCYHYEWTLSFSILLFLSLTQYVFCEIDMNQLSLFVFIMNT